MLGMLCFLIWVMTAQVYTYENIHSLNNIIKANILYSMFIITQLKNFQSLSLKYVSVQNLEVYAEKKILNRGAGNLTTYLVHINAYIINRNKVV